MCIQFVCAQHEQFKFRHLSIKDGLSDHEISSFYKDSRGFLWVGTNFGLNRFDGYKVRQFLHDARDTTSLADNGVSEIFETPDGQLGILTFAGLTLYDPLVEKFTRNLKQFYNKYGTSNELRNIVHGKDGSYWFIETRRVIKYFPGERSIVFQNIKGDTTSIIDDLINDLSLDGKGNAWIIHSTGVAEKLNVNDKGGYVSDRIYSVHRFNKGKSGNYSILFDADGDIWFCTDNFFQGIFLYEIQSKKLQLINQSSHNFKLNTNRVSSIIEVKNGIIWVGTDHGGINVIDKHQGKVRYILHREEDPRSLSESSIRRFYRDDQGIVWAGTYKRGVSYYHENIYRFDVYKHYSLDATSLPFEDINKFEEDAKGNLWIGTNGGGLLYFNRKAGTFTQYRHDPNNKNSISGDIIVSLWMDADQNLWIGTFNAGLNKFDGKKFTRYEHVPGDTTSLPSPNIWDLFEDSKGRFWIGTIEAGIALMDKKTNTFHHLPIGPNSIQSPTISSITEDHKGRIWFATNYGVDVLLPDGKTFTHYEPTAKENSLSSYRVLDILEDSNKRLWIATMDGLNLLSDSLNGFIVCKDQLPHHVVMNIREDNTGKFWMSTFNGLCEMTMINGDPNKALFKYYGESDGLQGTQFNISAAFKTSTGELIFGGPTGFNIFTAQKDNSAPTGGHNVTFTALKLFQKTVTIGENIDGVVILPKSISNVTEIVLPPNSNFFSIELSSLNYFNPEKSQYMYKLDDVNQDWLKLDPGKHEIGFTGLSPGQYTLRVRTTDDIVSGNTEEKVLSIIIQPPLWKTKTAFTVYAVFLMSIMYVARRLVQQREKLKFTLEQERQEVQRIHELDMLKVKFFTNVSHEFRTPLTLILTPIERLLKGVTDPLQLKQFQLIQRNGKRLMTLVNQLLDFKKLEVQDIKFNPSEGDIVAFVRDTAFSFSDLAEKKNISLQFHSSLEHFQTLFDSDKLEKILFNVLSNAFKFTLDNGTIVVNVDHEISDLKSFIQIQVSDTGIGMPQDKLDKIFEPFFQNELPRSIINQGSGIGLAITKEFVRIQGGTISVTSQVGKGSTFTIMLPTAHISQEPMHQQSLSEAVITEYNEQVKDAYIESTQEKGKKLLLVEDDDDLRFYLKDNLKFQYKIYEARNGEEGWSQVMSIHPDLIVSDIMMPEMNGIDLCVKIKTDERVSHIPVILLTARSNEQQHLEGLKVGAEDYITKPFNFEVLEARIENLLARQQKSQKSLRKTLDVKASELQITPLDEKFIEKAIKCVEKNVSSTSFSVEDLGEELGISRAYVFKKIQVLTGKTPLEFIRTIRLQHAAQLLEKSQLSVREVAYKVGFNSPKYFTKYFKEQFNVLPSNYAASKKEGESM
ncbi:MAG TPA: two-component regulator propeller domain-containing protein [Cyclobacteriaceae bacterium]